MTKKSFHVVPYEEGWALKEEGRDKPVATFSTQKEAIDDGRERANGDEQVDLIVHRQDGRIRNHITFSDEGVDGANRSRRSLKEEVHPENLVSVGSRVSWSAMFAGIVIAVSIVVVLGLAGAAMQATLAEQMTAQTIAYISAIWAAIALLVGVFLGGFTISQTTAGETKSEAGIYGVLLWASLFVVLPLIGAVLGAQGINLMWYQLAPATAELTAGDRIALGWIAVATMLLALLAAIGGAVYGAGPRLLILERGKHVFARRRRA